MTGDDKDKFENVAKELGCDESEEALDRAFKKLDVKQEPADSKEEDPAKDKGA
ncbi:hypothetical protein [Teredinibacter turnerae]|uniref:hypothetical protein n=1 Tax=Teredinibacter turnerae TaxID=2426 RepID=UPI000A7F9B4E|nr:hypothetical protein [Teredinibacter turnerae]